MAKRRKLRSKTRSRRKTVIRKRSPVRKKKSVPKKKRAVVPKKKKISRKVRHAARTSVRRSAAKKFHDVPLLEALTGSPARARIMRLLMREPHINFLLKDVSRRINVPLNVVKREIEHLQRIGVLQIRPGSKGRIQIVAGFPFAQELQTLAVKPFPIARGELLKILGRAGQPQLVLVSGIFLNQLEKSRVDLFFVANKLSEKRLEAAAKKIEAAVGAELRWAGMETKEFLYRWKMFDRFVREILAHPHEKIIEKIKL